MTRENYEYTFYYRTEQHGEDIDVCTKNCKQPDRTKVWNELTDKLNRGEAFTIGYK